MTVDQAQMNLLIILENVLTLNQAAPSLHQMREGLNIKPYG